MLPLSVLTVSLYLLMLLVATLLSVFPLAVLWCVCICVAVNVFANCAGVVVDDVDVGVGVLVCDVVAVIGDCVAYVVVVAANAVVVRVVCYCITGAGVTRVCIAGVVYAVAVVGSVDFVVGVLMLTLVLPLPVSMLVCMLSVLPVLVSSVMIMLLLL